jgi:hypothetical protein
MSDLSVTNKRALEHLFLAKDDTTLACLFLKLNEDQLIQRVITDMRKIIKEYGKCRQYYQGIPIKDTSYQRDKKIINEVSEIYGLNPEITENLLFFKCFGDRLTKLKADDFNLVSQVFHKIEILDRKKVMEVLKEWNERV